MPSSALVINASSVARMLKRIAHEIAERNVVGSNVALVGIQRGGVYLAERIGEQLKMIWDQPVPIGRLDVGMHRDDLNHRVTPEIYPTTIEFDVTGKIVVLVDDVIFSGRTTRAAMDALNDFGRPKAIQLAVLVDRGHRELPIRADFVGKDIRTSPGERVRIKLREGGGDDRVYVERA